MHNDRSFLSLTINPLQDVFRHVQGAPVLENLVVDQRVFVLEESGRVRCDNFVVSVEEQSEKKQNMRMWQGKRAEFDVKDAARTWSQSSGTQHPGQCHHRHSSSGETCCF